VRSATAWAILGGVVLLAAFGGDARGELTPSGYEVVTITLASSARAAPAEPPAGPSANPAGDVAFVTSEGGKDTLFLRYAMGVTTAIVAAGDPLAGSTIARLVLMPTSLDLYRQILFYAVLADGRAGLFRASPPPAPFIVSPAWGYRDRPISFHLTGDGFTPGIEVRFGETLAGFVTVISRSELTGLLPAGAGAGFVDVTTARAGGAQRSLPAAFEFRDPPTSGCRGFWPDHRAPAVDVSSMSGDWWILWAAVVAYRLGGVRRRSR
jgi:hypothetical protein